MDKSPVPFYLNGGSTGILMLHGFTGAPPEMRLIGDYLHQRRITVSAPLLPGHGTYVEDMNHYHWTDWVSHAKNSLDQLKTACDQVFVAGLSLGSLITLNLAAVDNGLSGAILYSPSIRLTNKLIYLTPVLKFFIQKVKKNLQHYENQVEDRQEWTYHERPMAAAHELLKIIHRTRKLLPAVKSPLLVVQSSSDEIIDSGCARFILDRVGSEKKEKLMLRHSGHCLTVDEEWEMVAEKTLHFIDRHKKSM